MKELATLMEQEIRVLLVGPPGCGKTARVKAIAHATGRRLIVMRASLMERVDVGGCLMPDAENGVTRALPLELLADLRSTKQDTLLFLDDLGQAPIDVQAALMRLFDADELSPHVLIWAATNRPADKAGVVALCEPLRSRFHVAFAIATPLSADSASGPALLGDWASEVAGWCDWLLDTYPDAAEVYAWHRSPQLGATHAVGPVLYGWAPSADPAARCPDFRSWETVARLWSAGVRDLLTISAAIGRGQAAAFLAFAEFAKVLPAPEVVFANPAGAPVPTEPSALALIATRLSSAVQPKQAGAFVAYCDRMPRVFAALAVTSALRRLGVKLAEQPAWQRWHLANQELFTA